MTKKLSKADEAYNACVSAINELDPQIIDLLAERNRLAAAAETICHLNLHKQHTVVGK
jgi:chorismate mutase